MNLKAPAYNQTRRVLLHLALWAGIYCLLLLLLKLPLQASFLDLPLHVFVVMLLMVVALNHYVVAYGLARLVEKKKWLLVAASLLGLFLFSAYATNLGMQFLVELFPGDRIFHTLIRRYDIKGIVDLFSLSTFTWTMSFVFPFSMLTLLVKFYKKSVDTARRNMQLQKMNAELELNFLRSQMNPHFFFNTLNSLYSLVFDNERAAKIVLDLSDMMRFTLYEAKAERIRLEREIRFLTDYIGLEALRYHKGVLLDYHFALNGHEEAEIPPLLLVNFIENAFKHGLHNTVDSAWVKINLHCHEGVLTFSVINSKPLAGKSGAKADTGIGLKNAKRRLDMLYPGKHALAVEDTAETFSVELQLQLSGAYRASSLEKQLV